MLEIAAEWGHSYAAIVKEDGYPVGITSKKPIVVKNKIIENSGHGLLHVETYGHDFLVTHLNPSNAKTRHIEARFILDYIKSENLDNFLLLGDMNAHSPMYADFMDANRTGLLSKYAGKESKNLIEGRFDYSTISSFLSYPLVDVCRIFVPVSLIDKVVDAFIYNEGEPDYLSDHYPIGVDLLLEK